MANLVGIPRGLFYYHYYPLWKTFLNELGAEILVSDFTTKKILDDGVKACVDEACLPVKLYHGHVLDLKDKVDYLLIPRFTSISKNEYICPKFGGLPDMVRHTLKDLPPIIDAEVNMRKSRKNSYKAALEVGRLFCKDQKKIRQAFGKAYTCYRQYREDMKKGIFPEYMFNKGKLPGKTRGEQLNIVLIGHVYNLFDSYINMDLVYKLMNRGVNILTLDMVDNRIINENSSTLNKRMFWNFGRKAIGSTLHFLDRDDIDGIIYIMSFGCGVDSFVSDLIERRIRRNKDIPFTVLTLDEHSGEAGLDTRIEAFIDMIKWRKV